MEIGISTACFYPIFIEETVPLIKKMGFTSVEIFLNSRQECKREYCEDLRRMLDHSGISVYSVHSYTSAYDHVLLFSEYGRRLTDALDIYSEIAEAGKILGARYITVHGNRLTNPVPIDVRRYAEILKEIIDIAAKRGLYISQENVSWCQSANADFIRQLREYADDRLCFTLDIKQAYRANTPVNSYIEAMAGKISAVHINDCNDENFCLLPGKGNIDYSNLFSRLGENGFNGDLFIEVYNANYSKYEELEWSRKHLQRLISKQ